MTDITAALPAPHQAAGPPVLARLAIEEDRTALLELFRAHLAKVSPWLVFDESTSGATFANYIQTADPTIYVAEDAARQIVGYSLATFNGYASTMGYFVCLEETYAQPGPCAAPAVAALGTAFEDWAARLSPQPLEVMLGVDIDLEAETSTPPQREGSH